MSPLVVRIDQVNAPFSRSGVRRLNLAQRQRIVRQLLGPVECSMKKRHKAVFPVLCLALILCGTAYIYRSAKDSGLGRDRAAIQSCNQARDTVKPDLGSASKPSAEPALEDCERKNK